MADRNKESGEGIRTHKVPGPRDPWNKWRRGKPTEVVSNPWDIPASEWPLPPTPPEIHAQERRERQLKAGVGTHASRTAAGMDQAEARAEEARKISK